jgi:MerR family transcriptional regulator, redox-sensitive transcriptional activator SoxR
VGHARSSSALEVNTKTREKAGGTEAVMTGLTIGQVAERAGVRASALRYYEQIGLLPPTRRQSGQRRYDPAVFNRLALIGFARRVGFTIAETKLLLTGFPNDAPASARWQNLARRKQRELEAIIANARHMHRALDAVLQCECRSLDDCGRRLARHRLQQ